MIDWAVIVGLLLAGVMLGLLLAEIIYGFKARTGIADYEAEARDEWMRGRRVYKNLPTATAPPLPPTKDDDERTVQDLVDAWQRWTDAAAITKQDSEAAARRLVEHGTTKDDQPPA